MIIDYYIPWFYAGPYVPSGVMYGHSKDCNASHWLVPGYERWFEEFAVINIYDGPWWKQ